MPRKRKKTRSDFSPYFQEVVKIVWEDPLHTCEITEKELDKEPDLTFTSWGLVIRDDGKRITLASTIGNEKRDKLLREVTRIPWTLVKSINYLEEV